MRHHTRMLKKHPVYSVKYADDLVLLAKDETVLQGMTDRLIDIGRCYGMEMNVGKTKVMRISRELTPSTSYDRRKTTGECTISQISG